MSSKWNRIEDRAGGPMETTGRGQCGGWMPLALVGLGLMWPRQTRNPIPTLSLSSLCPKLVTQWSITSISALVKWG